MGFKRKNYFINQELQGKYIFKYFLLVVLGSIFFSLIFSFLTSNTLSIVYDNYHLELGTTPGILFKKILSTQWFFIVTGGFITIIITLFLTHRIAGPFYRFEKTMDAMGSKDLSQKIVLRKKDEGKALAGKINEFNKTISNELDQLLTGAQAIDLICKDFTQDLDEDSAAPHLAGNCVSEIDKINRRNLEILHEFILLKG